MAERFFPSNSAWRPLASPAKVAVDTMIFTVLCFGVCLGSVLRWACSSFEETKTMKATRMQL